MAGEIQSTDYGPMAGYFESAPLGSLCVEEGGVQTGPFGSQLHHEDYVTVGTPIITVEHLGENRIIRTNLPRVSDEDRARLSRYSLQDGDIVFSRVGSVDRRALVRQEEDGWLFSGRCLRVRVDKKRICPQFLSWVFGLEGFKEHIRRVAVGATMPSINTKILSEIPVYFPPLPIQQRIAQILGALDDKIELNRRMNATLEAMARALFQSWFVDFDPVRAKLDGRKPTGLDPDTAALFSDSFQESTLGPIPHGWRAAHLEEIANVGSGKRPEGRCDVLSSECNIPLYGGGGRMGYVPSALYENPILFTGRVGTLGLIFRTAEPSWPSDNTLIVQPQAELFDFVYFVLKGFDLITLNRGSTQPLLTQTDLKRQLFVLPTKDILYAFAEVAAPIFRQMVSNEKQSHTLAILRDTLCPNLFNGKITL
jgi:type I restriction enzyme, S subunit